MTRFSRRDFLKFTSAFFAFIPTIKNLMSFDATAENNDLLHSTGLQSFPPPPPLVNTDLIAEKYESGIAKIIEPDRIMIENYKGLVKLRISNKTTIWDDINWVGELGCEAGDEVVAWGTRLSDNSLQCEKLYFNIVNLIGEAAEIRVVNDEQSETVANFFQYDRFHGRQLISIVPFTLIEDSTTSRKSFKEQPILPKNKEIVQVIGRAMKNGTTLAVVLYLSQ